MRQLIFATGAMFLSLYVARLAAMAIAGGAALVALGSETIRPTVRLAATTGAGLLVAVIWSAFLYQAGAGVADAHYLPAMSFWPSAIYVAVAPAFLAAADMADLGDDTHVAMGRHALCLAGLGNLIFVLVLLAAALCR